MDPEEGREGPLENSTSVAQLTAPLDTQLAQQELYERKWPELAVRSSNISKDSLRTLSADDQQP